jgi:cyclic pyranopterin monophosphate synthase
MKKQFTHIDESGNPQMVDVSGKKVTQRVARAQAKVVLGAALISRISNNELITKKGPVFQTAIIAGVMAAKKTPELIPFCHSLNLDDCQVAFTVEKSEVVIEALVRTTSKTGVEMEALTAATVAALTVYDMCKALSHDIVISEVLLMEKTGGKKNFKRRLKKS